LWGMTWRVGLIIFGILGVMGTITGLSIRDSFEEYKTTTTNNIKSSFVALNQTLSNQVESAHLEIAKDVATKFQVFAVDASNQIASAYCAVTNEISDEFRTPNIRKTVEDVARGQAGDILRESVQPEVERFTHEADFIRLCTRARGYDFRAYRELLDVASQTNEDAVDAREALGEIDRSLEKDRFYDAQLSHRIYMSFSGTNLYRGPFTSDEIALIFSGIAENNTAENREAFVNTASDLNEAGFLPLFINVLTNEPDLGVADQVMVAISKLTNLDWHPHDFGRLELWWQAHKSDFTNWPSAEFAYADTHFGMCDYRTATESFERVLQMDPGADMSRAFAIVCECELSETNAVATLAKGFKFPDGRWEKLAAARVELDSGSTSNATVHLAQLFNSEPTMAYYPRQGDDVWKRVDWPLYNRLRSPTSP
jgi:hypothetical protein